MAETTLRLKTSGMHCGSCAMLIDMTLTELDGVSASKSDAAAGETIVTFDDTAVTPEVLVAAVQGVGYEAEVDG